MPTSMREHVAEAAILLAIVVGGWFYFIDRPQTELRELDAAAAQATSVTAAGGTDSFEQLAATAEQSQTYVAEVQRRNAFHASAAALYETIKALAGRCDVVIHQLNPSGTPQSHDDGAFTTTKVSISIEGEFNHVAEFLAAVQSLDAFVRASTVSVTPVSERAGFCTAEIQCEILRFAVPGPVVDANREDQR